MAASQGATRKRHRAQRTDVSYEDLGLYTVDRAEELHLVGRNTKGLTHSHLCVPCGQYLARRSALRHFNKHRDHAVLGIELADGRTLTAQAWRESWQQELPSYEAARVRMHPRLKGLTHTWFCRRVASNCLTFMFFLQSALVPSQQSSQNVTTKCSS